jgi:hypothetical protein
MILMRFSRREAVAKLGPEDVSVMTDHSYYDIGIWSPGLMITQTGSVSGAAVCTSTFQPRRLLAARMNSCEYCTI